MWLAVTFAAIPLAGTVFMLWFLIGLLGERAPSTCYLVVPVRREWDGQITHALSDVDVDDNCRGTEFEYSSDETSDGSRYDAGHNFLRCNDLVFCDIARLHRFLRAGSVNRI
jgi:hypothetical protein